MKTKFTAGTVIVKDEVRLPDGVKMDTEPCAPGWKVLTNVDRYGFDRLIVGAGWNFFCVADTMAVTVIGSKSTSRVERGIKKLAERRSAGKFNALDIMEVRAKSFLGMPYVKISARSCHIQESMVLVPRPGVAAPAKDQGVGLTAAPALV